LNNAGWTLDDDINPTGTESSYILGVYKGDLYIGFGQTGTDGDVYVCNAGDSVKSTTMSFDSSYYNYVSSTYDGSNMRMYLNGSLEATQASTRTIETNAEPFYIGSFMGSRDQSGQGWFDGSIDEMRISKTARSAPWLSATYDTMEGSLPDLSGGEETVSISDGIPTSTFYDFTTSQNNGGNDTQVSEE
jgi:hypothetical protein